MRDRRKNPLRLEGRSVILDEISPKYFPYVIKWRNDPKLNRFLNQPFVLTEELERKWYEEKYLTDDTQGFMVMIDRETGTPFGTQGWANMDYERRRCTEERLLLGDPAFRASAALYESFIVLEDYLFQYVDTIYGHVVIGNTSAVRLNSLFGDRLNEGEIQYPENLVVDGKAQREYYHTRQMYEAAREKVMKRLFDVFWQR